MGSGCVEDIGKEVENDEVGEIVCKDNDCTSNYDARAGYWGRGGKGEGFEGILEEGRRAKG